MTPPELSDFLEKAQAAQAKIAELQRGLASRRIEGEAGGGMVTVVASGALRILEVRIEPSLLEGGDREMIQDLTAAATNAALTNAQRMVQEEFQRASIGIQLPGAAGPGGPT